ncbi:MAG: hypothetical protein HY359_13090 [Candidatus Rokubacteria bacterium]|nr:hypothetical protein [Candidatus Rokubacteria bacterium]
MRGTRARAGRWRSWVVGGLWTALATAPAGVAEGQAPGESSGLRRVLDNLEASAELVGLYTATEPAGAPGNPGNAIKAIPRGELELELRTRLTYRDRAAGLLVSVSPFLTYDRSSTDRAGAPDRTDDAVDLFVNEYVVQVRELIPRTTLTVSRQDVEWSPGFFDSPSNPFSVRTSTDTPLRADPGADFVLASVSPTDELALTYYNNYDEGAREPSVVTPFRKAQLGVLTYVGERFTVSLVGGRQEDTGGFVGSYAQWTVDDALLVYYDGAVRQGSLGLYPVRDPSLPTGGRYAATKDSAALYPEVLVGAAYTTPNDYTLYAEYFYYGPGYDDGDLALARRINRGAADLLGTELDGLGRGTLGQAALSGLRYAGQHFLNLQASKTIGAVQLVAQNALSLQDWTGRLFASVQFGYEAYRIALTGIVFYGRAGGIFRQDIDGRLTIGVARHF